MLAHLSAEELRRIYLDFPIASCVVGRDGLFRAANTQFAALIRAELGDLPGQHVLTRCGEDAATRIDQAFAAFDAGVALPHAEVTFANRVFIVAARPVYELAEPEADTQPRQVAAICVALTDITRQKRLEARLELANRNLQNVNLRLAEAASTDALTGLWNRHALEDFLPREIMRCRREGSPLAVLLVDIDEFKKYNDRYGHLAGDDTLHAVAQVMNGALRRPADTLARFGGEEFLAVLPGTGAQGALKVAETLRMSVASLNIEHALMPEGRLSVSIGAACLSKVPHNAVIGDVRSLLIERADQALYAVKAEGGRGIRLHWDGGGMPSADGQLLPAR